MTSFQGRYELVMASIRLKHPQVLACASVFVHGRVKISTARLVYILAI